MTKKRCPWLKLDNPIYVEYHDREWGRAVHDDRVHFEFLILEGAQAGLSWETVLNKREGYRKHFDKFDPKKVAKFTKARINKILKDPGVIRNRLKVESAVKNAQLFLEVQNEFGSFDKYIWSFVGNKPIINSFRHLKDYPATTKESDALSKDLKKRGFKFVGSTIIYAHMQACGLTQDHSKGCYLHGKKLKPLKAGRA